MPSPYLAFAIAQREVARADFEDYRLAAYERAAAACRGALLNEKGRRAGIDSLSLFIGSHARAHAYASDELKEWWRAHPRLTLTEYEEQHLQGWLYGYPSAAAS